MELINIEDLKRWRANRIQGGQCSFDDMQALGHFIDQVEKIDIEADDIVKCRECKNWSPWWCSQFNDHTHGEDFCCFAERRETMSRWIDAEWLKELYEPWLNYEGKMYSVPVGAILANIDDAPSIDIVRCKECKYCNEWEHPNGIELYCNNPNVDPFDWGGSVSFYVKADDYCSYGERRE